MRYLIVIILCLSLNKLSGQIHKWVEPSTIDTTLIFNDFSVNLTPGHSKDFTCYFLPDEVIDSISQAFDNAYQRALAIEQQQLKRFGDRVKREEGKLFVKLDHGLWIQLELNPKQEEMGQSFEYYFQEFGYYSIRVQWSEGNNYKLVNAQTGETTYLQGRPFFAPDGKLIIALGSDIEAGYSFNGVQLLKNELGKIIELGRYSPEDWGCVNAQWLGNKKLMLKNISMEMENSQLRYFNFYTQLAIK